MSVNVNEVIPFPGVTVVKHTYSTVARVVAVVDDCTLVQLRHAWLHSSIYMCYTTLLAVWGFVSLGLTHCDRVFRGLLVTQWGVPDGFEASSGLWLANYFPSVLICCWLGLLTCKTVSGITYTVLVETLNPAQSNPLYRVSQKSSLPEVFWHFS